MTRQGSRPGLFLRRRQAHALHSAGLADRRDAAVRVAWAEPSPPGGGTGEAADRPVRAAGKRRRARRGDAG